MFMDIKVRVVKAKAKFYKLIDRDGFYLFVVLFEVKSWCYDYRFVGVREMFIIGRYLDVLFYLCAGCVGGS